MSNIHAETEDFFAVDVSTKSEALTNLDRAAVIGISALVVIAVLVIGLLFLSL